MESKITTQARHTSSTKVNPTPTETMDRHIMYIPITMIPPEYKPPICDKYLKLSIIIHTMNVQYFKRIHPDMDLNFMKYLKPPSNDRT